MMISEFIERTHVEPSFEEYHFIEESYYEFDGGKDEFCEAWLQDKKSGKWELEYRLRKALEDQKAMYEKQLAEKDDMIAFFRRYADQAQAAKERARAAEQKLESMAANMKTWAEWLVT